jgi:hypothetical protein
LQSAGIMLPLALLAILAAWQLADARKVAEAEAKAEAVRYVKRIERRLGESFELLLDELPEFSKGLPPPVGFRLSHSCAGD